MIFSALGGIRARGKLVLAGLALGFLALTVPAQTASPFNLPLYFEANKDQTQFLSHGNGYEFLISASGAQIALHGAAAGSAAVQMQFPGANARAEIRGDGELPGKINYLIGNDPAKWQTGLPTFSRVQIAGIYPGINLVFHGNQDRLEYDFTIAAGANPDAIKIRFDGVDKISLTPQGGLVLKIGSGEVQQSGPEIYQTINGARKIISGGYRFLDSRTVAFEVGDYDHSQPLVIDPVLSYSTYFGGTAGTTAWAIALNTNSTAATPNGSIYIAGETLSKQFSTSGVVQTNFGGGQFNGDAFVAEFSNPATNLIYLTYLGGNLDDVAFGLAVDPAGNAFVAGYSDSTNFPTTPNAYKTNIPSVYDPLYHFQPGSVFVSELGPAGTNLIYSTWLGGTALNVAQAIAVDSADNAYVVGYTYSANFPVTPTNALQKTFQGTNTTFGLNANAFVTEIASNGTGLVYSTYLGGTNLDVAISVAVDPSNYVYVAGYTESFNFPVWNASTNVFNGYLLNGLTNQYFYGGGNPDAFVTKFPPLSSTITASQVTNCYSTFLGSTNADAAYGIACDASGNAYVTGWTTSTNFPNTITPTNMVSYLVTNGLYLPYGVTNAFLTKLNANGSVAYSTVFGGEGADIGYKVAVDSGGDAFVIGSETSTNFPVVNTFDQLSATNSGELTLYINNVFVTGFNSNCSSVYYSVLLGGNQSIYGYQGSYGYGIAVDASTNVYITGQTADTNFPTVNAPTFTLNETNFMIGTNTVLSTNIDNGLFLNGTNDAFIAEILFAPTAPAILAGPVSQTNGVGATVSFTITATNTTPLLYQWQTQGFTNIMGTNVLIVTNLVNGGNISGVSSNVLTITNITTNNAGTYYVVVSYGGGTITSNATLTVITSPLIITPLTNQTVGLGATVTFAITTLGQPPLNYSWQFDSANLTNGGSISGATTNALILTGTTTTNSGTYEVTVTNAFGATNSSATLTVLAAPEFVNFSAISNNVNNGLHINIVGGTNGGFYSFLWTTNLQTPIADWTNDGYFQVSTQGAISFPLGTNFFNPYSPQEFFLLESTNVP